MSTLYIRTTSILSVILLAAIGAQIAMAQSSDSVAPADLNIAPVPAGSASQQQTEIASQSNETKIVTPSAVSRAATEPTLPVRANAPELKENLPARTNISEPPVAQKPVSIQHVQTTQQPNSSTGNTPAARPNVVRQPTLPAQANALEAKENVPSRTNLPQPSVGQKPISIQQVQTTQQPNSSTGNTPAVRPNVVRQPTLPAQANALEAKENVPSRTNLPQPSVAQKPISIQQPQTTQQADASTGNTPAESITIVDEPKHTTPSVGTARHSTIASLEVDSTSSATEPVVVESATTLEQFDFDGNPLIESSDLAVEPLAPIALPLELLGSVVEPNQATLLNWRFEATFVDASAQVPVLVVNGAKPGPTLCLTAAVHGDELNGIEVVRRVIHSADPETLSGALIGVPIVNLQGFQRASRYLPDRRDLNRYFPGRIKGSYASRIAYSFFNQVISHCDYLVDIHTGSLSRTNLPQIRANLLMPEVAALAEKMGSIVVLQSKGGSGTLRRAASDVGIPSVTLEAGAPNNLQKSAVDSGVKSIRSAMNALGMTTPKSFWKRGKSEEPVFYQSTWVRARQGGILFSKVKLGDSVRKGKVLGLLSDPITNKTTKIVAPFDGRVIGMALNQVMYQGFAAYHIGLKSSIVEAAQPTELDLPEISPQEDLDDVASDELAPNEVDMTEHSEDDLIDNPLPISDPTSNPIQEMELPTEDADVE